jgi:hypothetical protein
VEEDRSGEQKRDITHNSALASSSGSRWIEHGWYRVSAGGFTIPDGIGDPASRFPHMSLIPGNMLYC